MTWSGATIDEKDDMNFRRYCATPKNIPTLVTLVGIKHLMMASTYARSILSSPPFIMYPKYTNDF
jgi:hypothetical protein